METGRGGELMPLSKISHGERLRVFFRSVKHRIKFFIGSRLPDARIEWTWLNDEISAPVCPRCGEFVYSKRQCLSCGQHFLPGAKTIGEALEIHEA